MKDTIVIQVEQQYIKKHDLYKNYEGYLGVLHIYIFIDSYCILKASVNMVSNV